MINTAPLKRYIDPDRPITYGIVQAGPDVPEGVPYIRPVDMTEHDGVIDVDALRTTAPDIARVYRRSSLKMGDIVVTIGPSYGKTMIVSDPRLVGANLTQGTARVAPSAATEGRYLRWALRSSIAIAHWDAAVGGATFRALNLGPLEATPVPRWSIERQRAIADFLDAETARIDALIAKKRRLAAALEDRFHTRVSEVLWTRAPGRVRLKRLCGLPSSGNRDHQSFTEDDSGVPCLRGLNVRPGRIEREELRYISRDVHLASRATRLRAGDVVVVRSGLTGSAAAIPEDLDDCNCVDLVVIRQRASVVPKWLEYVLNSREAQEQAAVHHAGAILTHFNAVDAGNILVPQDDVASQQALVSGLDDERDRKNRITARLEQQTRLLVERRRVLITAAATGQMEVPGVGAG